MFTILYICFSVKASSQQQYEATLLMWWFLIDASPIYTCISCHTYINKTAGFVKCLFSGIFVDSNARHFSFCPKTKKKYITDMCSCYTTAWLCKLQKGCIRLAAESDKAYQLLTHGRWFSPGTPASSTTKTGRHDIVKILLKVVLNTKNKKNQSSHYIWRCMFKYTSMKVFNINRQNLDSSVFSNVYLLNKHQDVLRSNGY